MRLMEYQPLGNKLPPKLVLRAASISNLSVLWKQVEESRAVVLGAAVMGDYGDGGACGHGGL